MDKGAPLEFFTFALYEPKYYDETLELLTKSYMHSSPFVKNLGLTEEHMKKEFKRHLDTGYYSHGVLAIHRQTGQIAGTLFWDLLEKFDWFEVDLTKVPSLGDVRIWMRQATLFSYVKSIDTKSEQYLYSGNVAVNPKYMGMGLGNILMYYFALDIDYHGYDKVIGCAINKFAQSMYEKPWSQKIGEIDCSIITTVVGEKPFFGQKINQKGYVLNKMNGLPWLEQRLGGKAIHPLRKSKL